MRGSGSGTGALFVSIAGISIESAADISEHEKQEKKRT